MMIKSLLVGGAIALSVSPFGPLLADASADQPSPGGASTADAAPAGVVERFVVEPGSPAADPTVLDRMTEAAASSDPVDPPFDSAVESAGEALAAFEEASPGSVEACAEQAAGDPCLRVRMADPATSDHRQATSPRRAPSSAWGELLASGSGEALVAAVMPAEASPVPAQLSPWAPPCMGTGSDGFRVQPVYAYDPSLGVPNTSDVDRVRTAMANADLAFSQSAASMGAQRHIRFVTNSGSAGCQADPLILPVTAGLADFEALVDELVYHGWISDDPDANRKYLIWTEGDLVPSVPGVCGVGVRYTDDIPGAYDNYNLLTSYAAVTEPCWDLNGGGSAPAHELMHTLGAVQPSAPHYDGNGHCTDEHDLMCYGAGTVVVPGCVSPLLEGYFDCNHDDYFNTAPASGSYLCRAWNTARSPYLDGWDTGYQSLSAIPAVWTSASTNHLVIQWSAPTSCPSASLYRITVSGLGSAVVAASQLSIEVDVAPGDRTITVTPGRDGAFRPDLARSVVASSIAEVPNEMPFGGMVLSINQGRDYGMLAWAIDPETGAPPRMRVWVEGVSSREYDWNYQWADMAAFTGVNDTRSLVFLANLPSGTRSICFDAQDPHSGEWVTLECSSHTVK